jgi:hypothetical protein
MKKIRESFLGPCEHHHGHGRCREHGHEHHTWMRERERRVCTKHPHACMELQEGRVLVEYVHYSSRLEDGSAALGGQEVGRKVQFSAVHTEPGHRKHDMTEDGPSPIRVS